MGGGVLICGWIGPRVALSIAPAGGQDTGGTGRRPLMAAAVKL